RPRGRAARFAALLFEHELARAGAGIDEVNVGEAPVVIAHRAVRAIIEAEYARAVVARGDTRQRGVGELHVGFRREIEHAAVGAVALLVRAGFLDRLHVTIAPVPEIGRNFFFGRHGIG